MQALIRSLIHYRAIVLIIFFVMLAAGIRRTHRASISKPTPDPSPPLIEVFIHPESALVGQKRWSNASHRSPSRPSSAACRTSRNKSAPSPSSASPTSKLYFKFGSEAFRDKQEVLNRLQTLTLPNNLQPQALSVVAHRRNLLAIRLVGPGYTLNKEIKATQDWLVSHRQIKQVPGIIDGSPPSAAPRARYQV